MGLAKPDLPEGALNLLILKVVALGPVHGYAIAQRLGQVSQSRSPRNNGGSIAIAERSGF